MFCQTQLALAQLLNILKRNQLRVVWRLAHWSVLVTSSPILNIENKWFPSQHYRHANQANNRENFLEILLSFDQWIILLSNKIDKNCYDAGRLLFPAIEVGQPLDYDQYNHVAKSAKHKE